MFAADKSEGNLVGSEPDGGSTKTIVGSVFGTIVGISVGSFVEPSVGGEVGGTT